MFSLFKGIWDYLFRKEDYYVLILGLDNAGKTTFLETTKKLYINNYNGVALENITSTVGLNVGRIELRGQRLVIWDLGGQEDLRTLWDKYYNECHGIVYVVDSSDPEMLTVSADTFKQVLDHPELQGAPLLILANKQDKQDALPLTDVEAVFDTSLKTIGGRDFRIQRISALKGEGVRQGIDWLSQRVREHPERLGVVT